MLLTFQIEVHYPKTRLQKNYVLTPSRKCIGRAIARGSRMSVISHCFQDPVLRDLIITKIGRMVQSEVATLCTDRCNSVLRSHSKEELVKFKWRSVNMEMRDYAPTLLNLLHAATRTRRDRPNRDAVIAMCTAMICKLRRPEMSTAQKTLSLILYAGHASKQVST